MANSIVKDKEEPHGIYIPPNIVIGKPLHFDNTDFRNDTPDGKSEFHGTGTVVLQKFEADVVGKAIEIERSSKSSMKFLNQNIIAIERLDVKPTPPNESFPTFTGIIECEELQLYSKKDKTWASCQVLGGDIRRGSSNMVCIQLLDYRRTNYNYMSRFTSNSYIAN